MAADYTIKQPQVEVADSTMVPRARKQAWSREVALTTLVTRFSVFPLQRLIYPQPSRACGFFSKLATAGPAGSVRIHGNWTARVQCN